jgi:plastocyanin
VNIRSWAGALLMLAAPAPALAETHTVVIDGMQFRPAALSVRRGDTIVWNNKDLVPHTATVKGGFDSGNVDPGKQWRWTVSGDGRIDYICTYHPGMKGSLTVRP